MTYDLTLTFKYKKVAATPDPTPETKQVTINDSYYESDGTTLFRTETRSTESVAGGTAYSYNALSPDGYELIGYSLNESSTVEAGGTAAGTLDGDLIITFKYKKTESEGVAVAAPAADPESGSQLAKGSKVTLSCATEGAVIYYTAGRTEAEAADPVQNGTKYTAPIEITGDTVIKAAAEKDGAYSGTAVFAYTVLRNTGKGLQAALAGGEEFTYIGSAITPAVTVTNNGELLTEGVDYTLKYSSNVKAADKNAAKAPKVTVTGKGNLAESRSITFSILPKDIGDEDVMGSSIIVAAGKTAAPMLFYDGVKLTAKDFDNPDAGKKFEADGKITITGRGNFKGKREIAVKAVKKGDLKKFTVAVDSRKLKAEPLVYDGKAKTFGGYFKVYDAADKAKASPLKEGSDYAVVYPKDTASAGKVKLTVVGLGQYCGSATKTFTIRPKAVKTEADGRMEVNVKDGGSYPYRNGGTVIPGLTVTCNGSALTPGKDYKATYSNNKKACSNNKAKCTITFTGNYKGSKAVARRFNITPAVLDDAGKLNGTASVSVGGMAYKGKPGAYKSVPYVTVNGVLLKASDYKASYYSDAGRKQEIDGKTNTVDLADQDKQTVYVKIEGKGNYQGMLTAEYAVCKLPENAIDLSKAKVSFPKGNKAEYTGEGVTPEIEVRYKSGREWKTADAKEVGTSIKVTYINNVNKGKATVMVSGDGSRYVGSKTAAFSIVAKSMKYFQ